MDQIISSNFADDKKLAGIISTTEDCEQLQKGINEFMIWCKENKLQINAEKCKVMTFTRKKFPIIFNYTIDSEPVKRVEENMDLGVIFDKKCTFRSHYEYACNRATTTLKFVKRQSQYFGMDTLKLIYQLLVRSILEFAAPIWSPNCMVHRTKLESIQKQMVLFLLGDDKRYKTGSYVLSPYVDRCAQLGLTTLVRRRVNATILFIHSLIMGKYQSPHLRTLMTLNDGSRRLRQSKFIQLRKYDNSPFSVACSLFNIAANEIDPCVPRNQFRTALMKLPDELFVINTFIVIVLVYYYFVLIYFLILF